MDCDETLERMMLALDGELPTEEWHALQVHLEACARCRTWWEHLQAVEQVLCSAPLLSPPPGFTGRVMARVDRRRARRRAFLGGLVFAAGAAIVLTISLLPALWVLPAVANFLTFLAHSGDILLERLAGATRLLIDLLQLLAGALLPLTRPLALCHLALALGLGILWIFMVRRQWAVVGR